MGVLIDHNGKFHSRSSAVVNKANRLLSLIMQIDVFGLIRRFIFTFIQNTGTTYLEYGNLIGGPNYKEDICKLEKFQQKAARMVNSTWHFEYEERLIYFLNNYPYQRRHAEVI